MVVVAAVAVSEERAGRAGLDSSICCDSQGSTNRQRLLGASSSACSALEQAFANALLLDRSLTRTADLQQRSDTGPLPVGVAG